MAYNNMNNSYYPGQYSNQAGQYPNQGAVYQQQNQQPVQMPQLSYTVRPVASREEAVAAQTDFLGLGALMPDLAHGVIYLKRFNQSTGTMELFDFRISEPEKQPQYATLKDLEALRADLEALYAENTSKKTSRRKDEDAE